MPGQRFVLTSLRFARSIASWVELLGVGGQCGELSDAQPGAHQKLHGDPTSIRRSGLRRRQQPGGGGVVEGLLSVH